MKVKNIKMNSGKIGIATYNESSKVVHFKTVYVPAYALWCFTGENCNDSSEWLQVLEWVKSLQEREYLAKEKQNGTNQDEQTTNN